MVTREHVGDDFYSFMVQNVKFLISYFSTVNIFRRTCADNRLILLCSSNTPGNIRSGEEMKTWWN